MKIKVYNEWNISKNSGRIVPFQIEWIFGKSHYVIEITILNFCIQVIF